MKRFSVNGLVLAALAVMLAYPFTKVDKQPGEVAGTPQSKPVQKAKDQVSVEPVNPEPEVEKPYNGKVPNFGKYKDVKAKKTAFFAYLTPTVLAQNNIIAANRERILTLAEKLGMEEVLTQDELDWLSQITISYRIKNVKSPMLQIQYLLNRVDVVPTELVLVQAANESAWGTSRFAREGLNLFGMWCYKKGCGMVPNSRTEGMTHEVAKYESLEQTVKSYLHNLNTNNAYLVFRNIREQLRASGQPLTAEILATGLLPYSERGSEYVLELTDMLRHNQSYFNGAETAP